MPDDVQGDPSFYGTNRVDPFTGSRAKNRILARQIEREKQAKRELSAPPSLSDKAKAKLKAMWGEVKQGFNEGYKDKK